MNNEKEKLLELSNTVIRICPACGVVNPSGPSDECPHLQLIRFDGVPQELESLLNEVAQIRHSYTEIITKLKKQVKLAARDGIGEVETPRKIKSSEIDSIYQSLKTKPLSLTHPTQRNKSHVKKHRLAKRKKTGPPAVDPRQLDLIAQSPSKGDA